MSAPLQKAGRTNLTVETVIFKKHPNRIPIIRDRGHRFVHRDGRNVVFKVLLVVHFMPLLPVSLNIVYYTTFSPKLGRFWQEFTMFFGIKSRPICRHASEDVERDIRATVSPMRSRVPALRLVPGINIHVVV